jgi:hypothetical protein
MHKQAAPWAAVFIFAALALAGCSGSGGGGGGESISIIPSDAGGGCYSFHAGVSLANYTWDLGDHYGVGYGADVEHCYTFKNGAVIVKLLNPADASHPFQQTLTIGSGQNQAPTMYLEADTNWAVLGEPVVFSASTSTDPDGDVLHYAWSCAKEAILVVPIGAHTHGNLFPYEPPAAGHVTVIHPFANHTLPAPTRSLDGASLCADSSKGSGYGTDSTVQVAINETGRYLVTVRGTDGVHPTISGTFQFYVTPQEWKPDPHPHHVFGGNITAPAPPQVPPDDLKTACEKLTSPEPPTPCGY